MPHHSQDEWPTAAEIQAFVGWQKAMMQMDSLFFQVREKFRNRSFAERDQVRKIELKKRQEALYDPAIDPAEQKAIVHESRCAQDRFISMNLEKEREFVDANYLLETFTKQKMTTPDITRTIDMQLRHFLSPLQTLGLASCIGDGDSTITLEELKQTLSYEGDIGMFKVDMNHDGVFSLQEILSHIPMPQPVKQPATRRVVTARA